jgi:hypothetical protein
VRLQLGGEAVQLGVDGMDAVAGASAGSSVTLAGRSG